MNIALNSNLQVVLVAVLAFCLAVGLIRSVIALVGYLRADRALRTSKRQAVHVRRRWHRLAVLAGLSVTDRMPTLLAEITSSNGQTPKPRILVPKIHVTPDAYGVVVHATCLPQVGLEEFQKSARFLADAWRCTRVSVLPDGPGRVVIRGVRLDPLITPTRHIPTGQPPLELASWGLGLDEYAQAVILALANVAGVTIAGLPGWGKTSLINKLICDLAPCDAVQFAVADGKVSASHEGDYADLRTRLFAFAGDDLTEANQLFKRLVRLRRARSSAIRAVLGVKNMWHLGPRTTWPLTVLIIDEAHTYFRDYRGNDPESKRLAALTADNIRLVEELVKKGRNVGIMTVLATQKMTGDALPTCIRDVCALSLSFAQKNDDAAVAALGSDIRDWPDASPTNLQRDPAYVGVAVMGVQSRPGFTRIRTPYVADADAARIAEATEHLTADPALYLDGYPGPAHWKPSFADDSDTGIPDAA